MVVTLLPGAFKASVHRIMEMVPQPLGSLDG